MTEFRHEETGGAGRYILDVDGQAAELVYRADAPGVIRIVHTEVPPQLGGRGLGGRLVAHAVAEARRRGLKIIPSCSFAAREFARHPEFADVRG